MSHRSRHFSSTMYNSHMKLRKIHNGTRKELVSRQYAIGVGVSLSSRMFTAARILEMIKWSIPFTADVVVVYVADSIHSINMVVRSGLRQEVAVERSIAKGSETLQCIRDLAEQSLPKYDLAKIVYATWSDVSDKKYQEKVDFLYKAYGMNVSFREHVKSVVREWLRGEERKFSDLEIEKFGFYVLEELPELVGRVPIKGIVCDAYIYPQASALTQFVEDLQNGVIFPDIGQQILDTNPKVFLEVR